MKTCPLCIATEYPDNARTCPTHGLVLTEKRELAPGTMFAGTYRIERVLGRGGMGVVYLAEHVLLGEKHALKFLALELTHNATFVQRFLREARRTRMLHSPHVVEVHFMGQGDDGSYYIAMEYVDGPNLAKVIEEHPQGLPVERALKFAREIALGLGVAHEKGMVHRDIKPGNVLLARDDDYVAKITDFGIVTGTEGEERLTRTGWQPLTPDYASPEQWKGVIRGSELDGRTDLYALGCVLFEMLTGRRPFDGQNMEELQEKHVFAAPPAPSLIRAQLGQWAGLDALVLRLMAKEREHRPANVRVFLAELDEIGRQSNPVTASAPIPEQTSEMKAISAASVKESAAGSDISTQNGASEGGASEDDQQRLSDQDAAAAILLKNTPSLGKVAAWSLGILLLAGLAIVVASGGGSEIYSWLLQRAQAGQYETACEAGNASSCENLAYMYNRGWGVFQDVARADELIARTARLFSVACEKGDGWSCSRAASYDYEGKQSYYWSRACSLGWKPSCPSGANTSAHRRTN